MSTTIDRGHPDHHAWQYARSRRYRCLCGFLGGKTEMEQHLREVSDEPDEIRQA